MPKQVLFVEPDYPYLHWNRSLTLGGVVRHGPKTMIDRRIKMTFFGSDHDIRRARELRDALNKFLEEVDHA